MEHATYAVRGNHDHGVAQGMPVVGEAGLPLPDPRHPPARCGTRSAPDERRYLLQLPVTQRFTLGGKRFLLVHATPRDPLDEYLLQGPEDLGQAGAATSRPTSSASATRTCSSTCMADGVVVLNPGSVGQPRDGDPRAAYAVIDDNRIELKRVAYPVEETIEHVEAMPWPRAGQGPA